MTNKLILTGPEDSALFFNPHHTNVPGSIFINRLNSENIVTNPSMQLTHGSNELNGLNYLEVRGAVVTLNTIGGKLPTLEVNNGGMLKVNDKNNEITTGGTGTVAQEVVENEIHEFEPAPRVSFMLDTITGMFMHLGEACISFNITNISLGLIRQLNENVYILDIDPELLLLYTSNVPSIESQSVKIIVGDRSNVIFDSERINLGHTTIGAGSHLEFVHNGSSFTINAPEALFN